MKTKENGFMDIYWIADLPNVTVKCWFLLQLMCQDSKCLKSNIAHY